MDGNIRVNGKKRHQQLYQRGRHHKKSYKVHKLLLSSLLASISHPVSATGFMLLEQNVTNLGNVYAGAASQADDASTGFYNAAGLTRLKDEQLVVGSVLVLPNTKCNVTRATTTAGTLLNPSSGRAVPSNNASVPLLHYAKRINDCWMFGIGAVSTFGSKTNYKDNSIVRYTATISEMMTFNLGPSLAYSFGNGFSVGGGLDALYTLVKTNARIDAIGTGNLNTDGSFEVTADNWGWGYHVAALYEPTDHTRFGLAYRSKIDNKLRGEALLQATPASSLTEQGVRSTINFPDSVALSAFHNINCEWAMMAEFVWAHWNRFKTLTLRFADNSQLVAPQNYKNSYRVALGSNYRWNDKILLKAGVSFDKTPTRYTTRNIFILDANFVALGLGAQYKLCSNLALDLGYAHVFYKKANFNQPAATAIRRTQGLQNVQGTLKNGIDVLGIQLAWDIT